MNRERWIIFSLAATMIMGSAGLLAAFKRNQRLGEPGVKVVAVPLRDAAGNDLAPETVHLPADVAGFDSELVPMAPLVLDWLPKDTTFGQRMYRAEDGFWIQVGAVLMGADRTSIHQPQYCLTGQGYQIVDEQKRTIAITGEKPFDLPVRRLVAKGTFRGPNDTTIELSRVLVYWFVAEQELTADHGQRMWRQAVEQLKTGVLQRWAYIACFAPARKGEEEAVYTRLADFIAKSAPEFIVR
jgi:hypothetical protein